MRWQIAQWFEKRWWRQYLQNKNSDEYLEWKRSYWTKFLNDLKVVPEGRILDAGCGPAGIFTAIDSGEVWAVDPLLDEYEISLATFSKERYPRVHFARMTLEKLDFDVKFNQVFCVNVINHVKDVEASLLKLHDVSEDKAQLILTTDCHRSKFFQWVLRALPLDILHPQQFTQTQYADKLETCGWKLVRTTKLKRDFIFDYHAFVCVKD